MGNYNEKRRTKRVPVALQLSISSLFNQDHTLVRDTEAPIEVINISRGGIGFRTDSVLPLDYYFNAKLNLLNREDATFYCVVKIIRQEVHPDGQKVYGCEFVGFPSILDYIFDELEESTTAR